MSIVNYKTVVVKVGSNVITQADGFPDLEIIENISSEIARFKNEGKRIVLVSSGAVAAGRSQIKIPEKSDPVAARQQLAAVGQIKLINIYADLFAKHKLHCAQVLVTKGDFRDRRHYLNMKNCVTNLLQNNIIPIVNENDVISVTELMFTDNDELTGLIASMIDADAVILLSSIDGLYDGDPADPSSKLIPVIDDPKSDFTQYITATISNFGRGGMITKCKMAQKITQVGITVHLANGKTENILSKIFQNEQVGTKFPAHRNTSHVKRWVAHSEGFAKGEIKINTGAIEALTKPGKASSLLPVGISTVVGSFEKGDVVKLSGENGEFIGLGVARYSSKKARERMGKKNQKPLVHYDYLYLNPDKFDR